MDKYFHPTFYNGYNYLSRLGLKLNHVSKRDQVGWLCRLYDWMEYIALCGHMIIDEDSYPLEWLHNGRDGVLNRQPRHCFLNCLFRRRAKIVRAIHRWPMISHHKWPVTRKFNDVTIFFVCVFFSKSVESPLHRTGSCLPLILNRVTVKESIFQLSTDPHVIRTVLWPPLVRWYLTIKILLDNSKPDKPAISARFTQTFKIMHTKISF